MKITAALAADLRILTATLDELGVDVAHSLHQLTLDAAAAVPSCLGLSVVITNSDPPFTVSVLADGALASDIRTSLHVLVSGTRARRDPARVALILYAGAQGAFVDLAADLAWLTGRPLSEVTLDEHLTVPTGGDIATPLQAASDINQTIGLLIGRGYTPQQAGWQLDTQAANNQTDRRSAAQLILDTVINADDDWQFDIH